MRFGLSLLIMVIFLASCNLPLSSTQTPDLIATEVANILTSTPFLEASLTAPIITPDVVVTEITPIPTKPAPTSILTVVSPSDTPIEVSLTSTATYTPTSPIVPVGEPTWKETFETGTNFGINADGYDDGNTRISIEDGAMKMVSINVNSWRGWRLASQKPKNYFLKADFEIENCAGSDQYGLITQAPDFDSGYGYYFGITCDGRYSIQKWNENGLSNLEGWQTSTAINSGANQQNQIGVLKSANSYQYFINETKVAEVQDDFFAAPGFFGPFIAGLSSPNFTVKLYEIAYWLIP